MSFLCGIDNLDGGGDDGNGDNENDKTVKMAEMVREAVDNGNGR
jgi:hypothetical protein